jgi:membrane protein required for colicin V production
MNGADWAIVGVLGLSSLLSLLRGLITELWSLATWVLAVWLAAVGCVWLGQQWFAALEPPWLELGLGFVVILIAVVSAGSLLGWWVRRLLRAGGLADTDRALGAIFGLLRGALVVVVAVWLGQQAELDEEPWWRESRLLPGFERAASILAHWLPPESWPLPALERDTAPTANPGA